MEDIRREITDEEFEKYKKDPAAYRKERREEVPNAWICGYGYYGCDCYESGGHYYRVDHIGGSCD